MINLETLLREVQILSKKEHPLEVLAYTALLVDKLNKSSYNYKGRNLSKYLEQNCLSSIQKALILFLSDLKEWNLTRSTEKVPLTTYQDPIFDFLHNLIHILEEDLKYVNKLKIESQIEYNKNKDSFLKKWLKELKKVYAYLTKLF